jgi:methylated-DNA-[protein]-cysteine S-methyltransferase
MSQYRGVRYRVEPSPLGALLLVGDGEALSALLLPGAEPKPEWVRDQRAFAQVSAQLRAYFAGELRTFDVSLAPVGTPFQQRVWSALREIPYGATVSYGELAARLGQPTASRAVGLANGRNPIAIIVPCHRVIGANGTLVGYGGGLDRKRWLLEFEAGARRLPGC